MGRSKRNRVIVAEYTNHNLLFGNRWRVSKVWRIDGSRLVSDIGEEIVLLPAKEV